MRHHPEAEWAQIYWNVTTGPCYAHTIVIEIALGTLDGQAAERLNFSEDDILFRLFSFRGAGYSLGGQRVLYGYYLASVQFVSASVRY